MLFWLPCMLFLRIFLRAPRLIQIDQQAMRKFPTKFGAFDHLCEKMILNYPTISTYNSFINLCSNMIAFIFYLFLYLSYIQDVGICILLMEIGNWSIPCVRLEFLIKEVTGFAHRLRYVHTCPNEPVCGHAFCELHFNAAKEKGVPTKLRDYLRYCGISKGQHTSFKFSQLLAICLHNIII